MIYFISQIRNIGFIIILIILLGSCKQKPLFSYQSLSDTYYTEENRPQYHFTPQAHWMNDPNGMVYYNGEYHLFYQYYPNDIVWGPMHWGHAVSKDLLHWHHLPIALYPDSIGLIFSGSVVIDKNNTAGLGKNAMVAIFTHHSLAGEKAGSKTFQNQSIAYSLDKGRTFTKFAGNPVIKNPGIKDFRDPKVIWHERTKKWIMVLAAYDKVLFYSSPDLKNWANIGEFGIEGDTRLWECPDLFPIMVEGSAEEKWVLITSIQKDAPNGGTGTSYFVGDFDGKKFFADKKNQKWLDYGKDNYAMVTWSNVSDGRRLAIGWMSNWQYAQQTPTKNWRSAMTLPRSLKLFKNGNDFQLRSLPIKEVNAIIKKTTSIKSQKLKESIMLVKNNSGHLYKVDLSFQKPLQGNVFLRFYNDQKEEVIVGYNSALRYYFIDRKNSGIVNFNPDFPGFHTAQIDYINNIIDMTIYLDSSSIELFADHGQTVMTDIFFPSSPFTSISINTDGCEAMLLKGSFSELDNVWRLDSN